MVFEELPRPDRLRPVSVDCNEPSDDGSQAIPKPVGIEVFDAPRKGPLNVRRPEEVPEVERPI